MFFTNMERTIIYKYSMLVLMWIAYASSYLLRKPLSLIKSDLVSESIMTVDMLGWLDVALLLPYAVVSLTMGWLADILGDRLILGSGLILGSVCSGFIGLTSNFYVMCLLLFGIGTAQGLCWPTAGSILMKWFNAKERNFAFGILGTSAFGGSVLATWFAVFLREVYGWRGIFLPCSIICGSIGVLVLLCAYSSDTFDIVIDSSDETDLLPKKSSSSSSSTTATSLSFKGVMKLRLVPEISFSILFIKSVRYSFLLWLPYFLHNALNYTTLFAGISSTVYDVGGVIGSLLNGFIVQRLFNNKNLLATSGCSILMAIFMMIFFYSAALSPIIHMFLLGMVGLFNCVAEILLTGPIAANIGAQNHAIVAVGGVVNGMGSVGSVLQGPVVAWLGATLGWMAIMPMLTVVTLVGGIASYRAHRVSLKCDISI